MVAMEISILPHFDSGVYGQTLIRTCFLMPRKRGPGLSNYNIHLTNVVTGLFTVNPGDACFVNTSILIDNHHFKYGEGSAGLETPLWLRDSLRSLSNEYSCDRYLMCAIGLVMSLSAYIWLDVYRTDANMTSTQCAQSDCKGLLLAKLENDGKLEIIENRLLLCVKSTP